jgi:hypothetical protein
MWETLGLILTVAVCAVFYFWARGKGREDKGKQNHAFR